MSAGYMSPLSDLTWFPAQETRRTEDKADMEVLHAEIQSLHKILYEVHQVRTKHQTSIINE